MSTFYTLRGRVKINLSGVYHYDARGATAECADLFGSLICSREGAEELLLEPDVSLCVHRCKTHACLSTAPVSRLAGHSSNGNPTYCSANDAWACSEASR